MPPRTRAKANGTKPPDAQAGAVFDMLAVDGDQVTFHIPDHAHLLVITREEWARFGKPDHLWVNVELIPNGGT